MPDSDPEINRKSGFAYAAGITLFASVAFCCGVGWFADKWFGSGPWLLIAGIVIGSAIGLFEFVRLSSKAF